MSSFDDAIDATLKHEGGFVNNPNDPGGATRYGISQRSFPDEDIANLTLDRAKAIYRKNYWPAIYDKIVHQSIATKLFDTGVNTGMTPAVKILQEALYACGDVGIIVDGKFGPRTLASVNNMEPNGLLFQMRTIQAAYYEHLMDKNPKLRVFAKGWSRRALS